MTGQLSGSLSGRRFSAYNEGKHNMSYLVERPMSVVA